MIVYHGSYLEILFPDINYSRKNVDFGKGFYVTPIKEQAQKWASRFNRQMSTAIVSRYELDMKLCRKNFKTLEFNAYTEDWLDFILACRRGIDESGYDLVSGGVANDKVFNTIELYFDGLIEKDEAMKRLQYEKPNNQICIRNQKIIEDCLRFVESEVI